MQLTRLHEKFLIRANIIHITTLLAYINLNYIFVFQKILFEETKNWWNADNLSYPLVFYKFRSCWTNVFQKSILRAMQMNTTLIAYYHTQLLTSLIDYNTSSDSTFLLNNYWHLTFNCWFTENCSQGATGYAKSMSFEKIRFNNVQNPIIIDQNYGAKANNYTIQVCNYYNQNYHHHGCDIFYIYHHHHDSYMVLPLFSVSSHKFDGNLFPHVH